MTMFFEPPKLAQLKSVAKFETNSQANCWGEPLSAAETMHIHYDACENYFPSPIHSNRRSLLCCGQDIHRPDLKETNVPRLMARVDKHY